MTIAQDIASLRPGTLVELFELDATALGGSLLRFHAGTNSLRSGIVWQGNTYSPLPIEATGFDYNGKGQLPRPILRVANIGGLVTAQVAAYNDLLGAKVTRKRTLAKYLDAVNFPDRRNLLLNTENANGTGWTRSNVNIGASAALSPAGTATQSMTETTTATVGHFITRSVNYTAGLQYTISASAAERAGSAKRYLSLVFLAAAFGVNTWVSVDLATGQVTGGGGTYSVTVTKLAPSGYRVTVTATASATVASGTQFRMSSSPTALNTYTGDGTSGLDVWDLQVEQAAAPTAYQAIGAAWSQNPTADPTAALPDDVFYVDRKASENKVQVEFELAAAFDVAGVQLPRRVITQNLCAWKYRTVSEASACPYAGTSYWDANDNPVATLAEDVCGKRLSSCKLRFGTQPLYFGGFPGAGLAR